MKKITRINGFWLRAMLFGLALFLFSIAEILALESKGTTIKRNADGCTVDIIIQIAVDGSSTDSATVKNGLEAELGNLGLTIPCPAPKPQCCKIQFTIIVRLKSNIPAGDQGKYHQIKMKSDGTPSWVFMGGDGVSSSGEWRDNASSKVIVHETLHLIGAADQYCDRVRRLKDGPVTAVMDCTPPNACCTPPNIVGGRCTAPCPGFETRIMATTASSVSVVAADIVPLVESAGLNTCPDPPCCPAIPQTTVLIQTDPVSTKITPEYASLFQYGIVSWTFTSYPGPMAPDFAEIVLPPNSPVNFGHDQYGNPILTREIPAGQVAESSPADWPPQLESVKYSVRLYHGQVLLEDIDPYLVKQVYVIPTLAEWALIFLAVILIATGTLILLRKK